jgi:hypothetical protein
LEGKKCKKPRIRATGRENKETNNNYDRLKEILDPFKYREELIIVCYNMDIDCEICMLNIGEVRIAPRPI